MKSRFGWGSGAAALLALAVIGLTSAERAQAASVAEQEQLLKITRAQPTNYDAAFEYARVSIELGDYEAAIGALERLLFFNPNLTRVKYELGALYFRLRSYELASRYFQDALASPDLDPVTRARIEASLPAAQKQRDPHQVSVFVQTGLRYQANANYAPSTGLVRFGGTDIGILPSQRRTEDWNAFALGGLSYDIDLQNQRGDMIETRVVGYGTYQFKLEDLSLGFVEGSFGPRLALAPDWFPGVTIKPYAVAAAATIDGDTYASYGGGIALGIPILGNWAVEPFVEWRQSDVDINGSVLPLSTLSSGESVSLGWSSSVRLFDNLTLQTRSAYRDTDGRFPWQSSEQYSSEAGLTLEFDPLWAAIPRKWSLSPYVRYARTDFATANPLLDPTIRRKDREWRTGLIFDAPITAVLGVSAGVHYSQVDSNLPNYDNDNLSFLIGPTAQF